MKPYVVFRLVDSLDSPRTVRFSLRFVVVDSKLVHFRDVIHSLGRVEIVAMFGCVLVTRPSRCSKLAYANQATSVDSSRVPSGRGGWQTRRQLRCARYRDRADGQRWRYGRLPRSRRSIVVRVKRRGGGRGRSWDVTVMRLGERDFDAWLLTERKTRP
jgi:hypothetical protein